MEEAMDPDTVLLFTRFGLGHAPGDLQNALGVKFLALTLASGQLPAKILFYTDGVRLACAGSPVLDLLKQLEAEGVELVLCKTCLDYFGLDTQVQVGVVGGMGDILEAMQKAGKVISL
jgi:sulfur relay (sulfurtransferase) complex TusBCD TusD component (DsrE family)